MRPVLLVFLTVTGCGRTGLDALVLPQGSNGGSSVLSSPSPTGGSAQGGSSVLPSPTGGAVWQNGSGGIPGGVGGMTATGRGGSWSSGGGAGGQPVVDDPATLGDERSGFVECLTTLPSAGSTICGPGSFCCGYRCQPVGYTACGGGSIDCDGPEDCPSGTHCCRGTFVTCQPECSPAANEVLHLSCGSGPCTDLDLDWVPDYADDCPLDKEDGRGPQPQDGCPDGDGDGIQDLDDKCPETAEDGLPPRPYDGCPAPREASLPIVDDPNTLGDERSGYVAWPSGDPGTQPITCVLPDTVPCDGSCVPPWKSEAVCFDCDGPEDCGLGLHCCRQIPSLSCLVSCKPRRYCLASCTPDTVELVHLPCGGVPCTDRDLDGIPDGIDQCPSDLEDGRGSLPQDGCPAGASP